MTQSLVCSTKVLEASTKLYFGHLMNLLAAVWNKSNDSLKMRSAFRLVQRLSGCALIPTGSVTTLSLGRDNSATFAV